MDKLENLTNMLDALLEMVKIDASGDEILFLAFNRGAEVMKKQVEYYINNVLKAGEQ